MSSLFLREFSATPGIGDRIELTGAEAKHAVTVNRIRVGESIFLGDGSGILVTARVSETSPGLLVAEALEVTVHERAVPEIFLVQSLAKGDRDELAVQAATELGVSGVIPFSAERSISRWTGDKREKGRLRWETIAREASKQSIRAFQPEVLPLMDLAALCEMCSEAVVLVLDPTAPRALTSYLAAREPGANLPILMVVGPEGGLSGRELERLEEAGAHRVLLGNTILRTSTAGPAALAVINASLGRW